MPPLIETTEQVPPPIQDLYSECDFAFFLEDLIDGDKLPSCDDAAPHSAQRLLSQPSRNIGHGCHSASLVLEDQEATNVLYTTAANEATAASALPTQETKLEKVRAKNRRNQKAYRQRQKVRCYCVAVFLHTSMVIQLYSRSRSTGAPFDAIQERGMSCGTVLYNMFCIILSQFIPLIGDIVSKPLPKL